MHIQRSVIGFHYTREIKTEPKKKTCNEFGLKRSFLGLEPSFDMFNSSRRRLKGLSQDLIRNRRRRTEQSSTKRLSSRKLTIESSDDRGRNITVVLLEVNKSFGESKHVTFLERPRDELVGRSEKPNVECSFEDVDDFGGTWVSVRRV